MVQIIKVDTSRIDWEVPNVFYRGNTQEKFEQAIIKSFMKGKPTYHGLLSIQPEGEQKRTYVVTSLTMALLYAEYRLKDIGRMHQFLTKHPLVMGIKADKYLDKLGESKEGEGMFILGDIDAEDIFVLLSSECDKLPKYAVKDRRVQVFYEMLIEAIRLHGLNNQESLVKRYKPQETMSDLESLCFGPRLRQSTPEEQRKIAEANAYLKRKLEGN